MSENLEKREKVDLEVKKLQEKLGSIKDKTTRSALELALKEKLDELMALGGPIVPTPEEIAAEKATETAEGEPEANEELPEKPTPETLEQAEKLIQQSRLEIRRNNSSRADELLGEALRIAPGSSAVQELVGDQCLERRKTKEARKHYDLARKLDPKNVSADRKYALLIFKTSASAATADMSLEYARDQMVTSAQKAAMFSLLLPGSGQILLGETVYGWSLMSVWSACVFWVFLWNEELKGILQAFGLHVGKLNPHPNYLVLLPVITALLIHIGSVFGAGSEGISVKMVAPERPAPPVDLPFE